MALLRNFLLLFVLSLILITEQASAQGIKGEITNTKGDPVPFANIYISNLTKGTTSNIDGKYELKLPPGSYDVAFQYIGYKTQEYTIEVEDKFIEKNIVLEEQSYEIPEVVVYPTNEDPAYYIMRKAMALAQYYKNQVQSYDSRVYLKGTGVIKEIPLLMEKRLKKEGIEEGETIITENISNIHFELPNTIEQEVISLRTNQYTQNIDPMGYINLSLYHEIESPISPLDKRAFNVYDFKLINRYKDKGRLINKIKVIPKREGYDLYSGYIHIAEDFWNIHSLNLNLEQKMFEVNIKRIYSPVKGEIWMPVSHHFDVDFSAMGFEGNFQYAGSINYKSVKRNEALDHSFIAEVRNGIIEKEKERQEVLEEAAEKQKKANLTRYEQKIKKLAEKENLNNREARRINRQIKKKAKEKREKPSLKIEDTFSISDSAKKRSYSYWDSIRPIPLTETEIKGYKEKDSLEMLMENPEYKDSVERAKTKFRFSDLLTGNTYTYDEKNAKLHFNGLVGLRSISFNTVDGFLYKKSWDYEKEYDNGKKWWWYNDMSYAFARKSFMTDFLFRYRYKPIKRYFLSIRGGRHTADFNSTEKMLRGVNMLNSLFLVENHIKLYQEDFLQVHHKMDLANGLVFHSKAELADRKQLSNNSEFYIWDPLNNKPYSSNAPSNKSITQNNISDHTNYKFFGEFAYTPRYYYKIEDNVKKMQYSRYPTFYLRYKGSYGNLFNSGSAYHYAELSMDDNLSFRGVGRINYQLTAGTFLNKDKLYFADFKHFSTNPSELAGSMSYKDFRLMDYYGYSTDNSFVEGHVRFRNDRILLKRLPVLNKTLMMENIYFSFLKTSDRKPYYEIGYGLDQVFLMFNLEVFTAFKGTRHSFTGFTISLPLLGGSQTISFGG